MFKNLEGIYEEGKRSWNNLKYKFKIQKVIRFTDYSENPAGVRISNKDDFAVQVGNLNSAREVANIIDKFGEVDVVVEGLELLKSGKLRMPIFKGVVMIKTN